MPERGKSFRLSRHSRLETPRLLIKKASFWRVSQKYLRGLNNKTVMQFTEARFRKWTRLSAMRFICRGNKANESLLFAVYLKDGPEWIGNIRIFSWHEFHKSAEVSFLFFDSVHWNKGYATESLMAVLKFAKEELGVRRVYGDYYELNQSSGKLFSKLGFTVEGTATGHFLIGGTPVDSIRVGKLLNE